MKLSTYNPNNTEEIKQLFTATFSNSEGKSEGLLIGNLVTDLMTDTDTCDLSVFIATEKEQIIGSIIFSRLKFESEINAFLLSPVAVHTSVQGKGIGQKLITFGLNALRTTGVELVVTYGDPSFYSKVGFAAISQSVVKPPLTLSQPEGWLGQSLVDNEIKSIAGNSFCVDAFNKPEIW